MAGLAGDASQMKVSVHWNFHRKSFSVTALEGEHKGKVIINADEVYLTNVIPSVSKAGRNRVLRTRQKNVHAKLIGYLYSFVLSNERSDYPVLIEDYNVQMGISYNPYKADYFYNPMDIKQAFTGASRVACIVRDRDVKHLRNPAIYVMKEPESVPAENLSILRMGTGTGKPTKVIDNGEIKQYVGIRWVSEGRADWGDYEKLPRVKR